MRGLLRWLRRLAISVLVVAVVVLAVALVTAHTGWGREQLRRRIEAALQDGFPGARVAALDGSLLGTLTLHDVELVRPDRGVRVTVRTLHVAVALWPLLFQTARLDRLIAEDVHAVVAAPQPALPARTAAASAWRIELPGAAIHRATVEIERARLVLDDLDIAGGMSLAAGRAVVSGSLRGRWRRADAPAVELTAQGTAVIEGGVQVPAALVRLDGAVIGATAVTVDLDRARGAAAVVAPASAIARLVPELACAAPCLGDVAAAIGRRCAASRPAAPRARSSRWSRSISGSPRAVGSAAAAARSRCSTPFQAVRAAR
ncbi:MAG: hypothetical protein E6J91_07405 [Deltaproteobacteria bacterium]|nr:MAG: hypothetical protein E6J91_07405 [Deltaproteobacteria bacterium]